MEGLSDTKSDPTAGGMTVPDVLNIKVAVHRAEEE